MLGQQVLQENSSIQALTVQVSQLVGSIRALTRSVQSLESKIGNLCDRVKSLERRIEDHQTEERSPHPMTTSASELLTASASDPKARLIIVVSVCVLFVLACIALLSYVRVVDNSPIIAIFQILNKWVNP